MPKLSAVTVCNLDFYKAAVSPRSQKFKKIVDSQKLRNRQEGSEMLRLSSILQVRTLLCVLSAPVLETGGKRKPSPRWPPVVFHKLDNAGFYGGSLPPRLLPLHCLY